MTLANKKLSQIFGNQMLEVTDLGVPAKLLDIAALPLHKKPAQVRDEIPTLNRTGYMKSELGIFGERFIEAAAKVSKPVLEIGPAYGLVTHKVLESGATIVALDACKEHLEVLLKDAPKQHLDKLYVYYGMFPGDVDFAENSFGAILASRILHFLPGDQVREGLDKIYKWLAPGGEFFATNCSIYHSSVKGKMADTFEHRIKKNEEWPGRVYKDTGIDDVHENYAPEFLNVFYKEQLEKLLRGHGFAIKQIEYFDYPSDIWPDDNKGHIGFVAKKT